MSTAHSFQRVLDSGSTGTMARLLTGLEIAAVYAGILLYIWQWQATHPRSWIWLLGAILLSHIAHRDRIRDLGITVHDIRRSAELVLPPMLVLFVPLILYGLARHSLVVAAPAKQTVVYFLGYASWCAVQQYLTQSYFHVRLIPLMPDRHRRSGMIALMFGAAHIPNLLLMAVTALVGFLFAEVFARHRSIWPLALVQAVGGLLLAAVAPTSILHNMRVGPGYFFYGIR